MPLLLICTVGGSPEPVVASIKGSRPDRVIFVASLESQAEVEGKITPLLAQEGASLGPGQYDLTQVPNAQDFPCCVEAMRGLTSQVQRWVSRGEGYRVVADFTGGTKCMSAALALVASRWPCRFSYVGGTERNKGGLGVVVSGREQVLHSENPWDSLGYQAIEEATTLFDQGDYEAAATVLDETRKRLGRADLKREMSTLCSLAKGYLAWDRFLHKDAANHLGDVLPNANNLRHLFPDCAEALLDTVQKHLQFLGLFKDTQAGHHFVVDLLANARRCADKRRFDDAVARLYRAIEASAQIRLVQLGCNDDHGRTRLGNLPLEMRPQFEKRASQEGTVLLALQDDYAVLQALGDELGSRFSALNLDDREKSPLSARNRSILAHGFEAVSSQVYQRLWKAALDLAGVGEAELPVFPKLRAPLLGGRQL